MENTLKTRNMNYEEMKPYLARFKELKPQAPIYEELGVSKETYEDINANELLLLMAPEGQGGPMGRQPAIVGMDGLSVVIARCPPGDKPMLHAHMRTCETFMPLKGKFRIRWGDRGEHETVLEQFDMIAVPPAVCRDFTNITDEEALLLVLVQGKSRDDFNDILFAEEDSQKALEKYGREVLDNLKKVGQLFKGVNA